MTANDQLISKYTDEIDSYEMSVLAAIGFLNFFRYDDRAKAMSGKSKIWQGRKMKTSSANKISPNTDVTPDLVIQVDEKNGVLAEIKYSFPMDQAHWTDDFDQLKSYDDDLLNWDTPNKKIAGHEIVLLPEQSRAVAVRKFYEKLSEKGDFIKKNFAIVEFNRADQGKAFLFFRIQYGELKSAPELNTRLQNGIKVHIEKLFLSYAKCKIYDSKPPMPYLLNLIWEAVVIAKASGDPKFSHLRRNGTIHVDVTLEEIKQELAQSYSFRPINSDNRLHSDIPLNWIREAMEILVSAELAEWKDTAHTEATVSFKKYARTIDAFKQICAEHQKATDEESGQMRLFK